MKIRDLIGWNKGVLVTEDEYPEFVKIMLEDRQWRWSRGQSLIEHNEFLNAGQNELVHLLLPLIVPLDNDKESDDSDDGPLLAVIYNTMEEAKSNGDKFITFDEFKEKLKGDNNV